MGPLLTTIAALMGIAFIVLPISIIQVLMSGWFDLAKRFPGTTPDRQTTHARGFTTLLLSRHRWYRVIARYTADDDHLHLRLISPAAIFHEPISIPWAAIEHAHLNPADTTLARVTVAGHPIQIALPPRLLEREAAIRKIIAHNQPHQNPDQHAPR